MKSGNAPAHLSLIDSGVDALDEVLGGGLPANHLYLITGNPGAGKTTLGLQFLIAGAQRGEKVLYVTLSETTAELDLVARSHGWSLDGIAVHELTPPEDYLELDTQYTMFQPSEIELNIMTQKVLEQVERNRPTRVVFDSLSEMRLLAQNPLRYRRQILALKQFFIGRKSTVLLLDDRTSDIGDLQLESIAHGVVSLEHLSPEIGAERRRLRVTKLRGAQYRGGYHDFVIRRGGLQLFPQLVATDHPLSQQDQLLESGSAELDQLLHGGFHRGTSVLLIGPAGCGKSSIAAMYAHQAARRGERAAIFAFDESPETFFRRCTGLGIEMEEMAAAERVSVESIDPAQMSPGEFASRVVAAVDGRSGPPASVVVIDSLNGYLNSMPEERFLIIQLHELLSYLGRRGVVTFLIVAQHGLVGNAMNAPVDASYLADAVLLLRYFEAAGELRQAISVVKKRSGSHERAIRELSMVPGQIRVGAPLKDFREVLSGLPDYLGKPLEVDDRNHE
jgi:circadian clock protein KaiC